METMPESETPQRVRDSSGFQPGSLTPLLTATVAAHLSPDPATHHLRAPTAGGGDLLLDTVPHHKVVVSAAHDATLCVLAVQQSGLPALQQPAAQHSTCAHCRTHAAAPQRGAKAAATTVVLNGGQRQLVLLLLNRPVMHVEPHGVQCLCGGGQECGSDHLAVLSAHSLKGLPLISVTMWVCSTSLSQ